MMEDFMSAYGGRLIVAIVGVGIGFLCLVGVLWLLRGRRGPSPFIRGGRNRQPRLQVLDAAAVDARRRLVLVRRDEVEHLIMIGGPTDIVIESGISGAATHEAAAPREATVQNAKAQDAVRDPGAPARAARPPVASSETRRRPPQAPAEVGETSPAQTIAPEIRSRPQKAADAAPRPVTPPPTVAPFIAPALASPAASPTTPAAAVEPALVRREPVLNEAADILDAARNRVFQGPSEPVRPNPASAQPPASAETAPKPLGSDFERILEEEMANNLATRQTADTPVSREAPRQLDEDAQKPRVTGATPEPSLQDEMARIFGEMSVTRDR
ncbi:hypothetical protein ABID21_000929 [Pseudorhizobium tarimense]|uniref:Flagellar biosynthesis protein FliO n=1 Tax=Pseudorhizobium tarimense TaxID=1079109 RepID=A0ABV2H2R4_9HYPH|nr:flagellar biosynthetic protein FliO [Pseudorhizobium tarimense]MCJ8518176.1 flagellar biosynthetic protein FliO [Pseudorhizobium tarimense]